MITWLRENLRPVIVNGVALVVVVSLLEQARNGYSGSADTSAMLDSGKWAVRFLLLCLAMTPLNTVFGWRSAVKLRKTLGLWAFGFAALHLGLYVLETQGLQWLQVPMQPHITLGILSLGALTAMAVTSNRRAMKHLGRWWKRLHRLVYATGCAVIVHGMLATTLSKKIAVYDPQAIHELSVYLAAVAVLLVIRIPLVRRLLVDFRHRRTAIMTQHDYELVFAYGTELDRSDDDLEQVYKTSDEGAGEPVVQ